MAKYDESDSEFRLFGGPISLDVTGEVAKHLREVPLSKPHGEWEVNYRSTYVPNSGLWLVVKVWISPDDPLVFPLRQAFNVWGRPRR